jgi:hypothetical protein
LGHENNPDGKHLLESLSLLISMRGFYLFILGALHTNIHENMDIYIKKENGQCRGDESWEIQFGVKQPNSRLKEEEGK